MGDSGSGEAAVNTPDAFGGFDTSTLAALIFEVASQLHAERSARLALQATLVAQGVLTDRDIERIGQDARFREQTREAANETVCRLLRTLMESSDERAPLRGEPAIG